MDNTLDFSSCAWNAHAGLKNVSYIIGKSIKPDPGYVPDPAKPVEVPPILTVYILDRMDGTGNQTRLGADYPSLALVQAAAQADANL